jgi:hypothetical protein
MLGVVAKRDLVAVCGVNLVVLVIGIPGQPSFEAKPIRIGKAC